MKIGLLGYGYTASFLARLLLTKGHDVWGTSRDITSIKYEQPTGLNIVGFNLSDIEKCMSGTSCILVSTRPNDAGVDPSFALIKNLIISHKRDMQWIGYLSSTGVYGDHQGAWVDELSPCRENSQRAINRLSAEQSWLSLYGNENIPVMIYRLAGIYGPGRNALERIKAGKNTTIVKKDQYFSRTHVYDIAELLYRSMISPRPGEIFNVCDDHPCGPEEVDCYAADLLQVARPQVIPYEKASLSPMAREFYSSNKRVSNARLKQVYMPNLRFPSYKEGLKSILTGEAVF